MILAAPIHLGGKEMTELSYDFKKITGWEFAEIADKNGKADGTLSAKQAIALFGLAAVKATEGVNETDLTDLQRNLGIEDGVMAERIALAFFNASSRTGIVRLSIS